PLSHDLEGVDEFLALCRSRRLTVLLGYKMRFHPSVRLLKNMIDAGEIGKALSARAHYGGYLPGWHPWEDYRRMYSSRRELGGGVILDAIHEIDTLYWLLGDVQAVQSMWGKVSELEIDTEDAAEILLHFRSGALGSVHMNYFQQPEYRYCHVAGTGGTLVWDTVRKRVEHYSLREKVWKIYPEREDFESNEMFVDEMKHFLACLEGREKPVHSLEDARRVLEIALWAKRSTPLAAREEKK
ncbi:MAG: Gfo/Idh/MocA family oxidoreductase, partial [Candidatus Omnitrophica bacterium]|nr:Gfo/Idh/MocA family oxidoreductase [Candidatus Omnitrophota bacterium]